MRVGKAWIINIGASLIGLIIFALLDINLRLGSFHGLVFLLYSSYFLGAQALTNIFLGAVLWRKKKKSTAKSVWFSGIAIPLAVFLLLLFGVEMIQSF